MRAERPFPLQINGLQDILYSTENVKEPLFFYTFDAKTVCIVTEPGWAVRKERNSELGSAGVLPDVSVCNQPNAKEAKDRERIKYA